MTIIFILIYSLICDCCVIIQAGSTSKTVIFIRKMKLLLTIIVLMCAIELYFVCGQASNCCNDTSKNCTSINNCTSSNNCTDCCKNSTNCCKNTSKECGDCSSKSCNTNCCRNCNNCVQNTCTNCVGNCNRCSSNCCTGCSTSCRQNNCNCCNEKECCNDNCNGDKTTTHRPPTPIPPPVRPSESHTNIGISLQNKVETSNNISVPIAISLVNTNKVTTINNGTCSGSGRCQGPDIECVPEKCVNTTCPPPNPDKNCTIPPSTTTTTPSPPIPRCTNCPIYVQPPPGQCPPGNCQLPWGQMQNPFYNGLQFNSLGGELYSANNLLSGLQGQTYGQLLGTSFDQSLGTSFQQLQGLGTPYDSFVPLPYNQLQGTGFNQLGAGLPYGQLGK